MDKKNEARQPVLVTTEHRGVFFGYLKGEVTKEQVVLADARNCVYWVSELRGFLGLAEQGPSSECRVGPKVPEITLYDVTSVVTCTSEAVDRWEAGPWAR